MIFVIISGREMMTWLKHKVKLPISIFLIVISLFLIYYNDKLNNSPEYWAGFGYGYYENVNQFIRLSGVCIAVVFTFCLFIYNLFSKIESKGRILVLLCFIPSFVLLTQQFFISRTYFSKNALMSMRSEISNKYVVQQYTHSFQFYSNSIPTFSFYDRASAAKIDLKKLYAKVSGYAIIKAFRNDNKNIVWKKYNGESVKFNGVNFIFVKEYKLRYYDYFLLKYNEKQ
ncbi:MAG: hypothetical protein IPG89_18500 [Bacteroidetes bacterium]|nr:hypothetical protein [Bacteroidota bacterium]